MYRLSDSFTQSFQLIAAITKTNKMGSKIEINLSENVDVVHLFVVYVYKLWRVVERWKLNRKPEKCLFIVFCRCLQMEYIMLSRWEYLAKLL